MRRPILALALFLMAGVVPAQRREGVYKPPGGTPVPWSINNHQTLIWGGQPYLPLGVKIDSTPAAVSAAKAAGITDVILDLPANGSGWEDVLQALNKANLRFLLRIDSLEPMAHGFAIEPQGYRITGITGPTPITIQIPGAVSAYVVLATKQDSQITETARVPIVNGELNYQVKSTSPLENILLVYPEMTSIEQPDYWEDLDLERDQLLGSLKRHAPGAGLRGIVNPMGRGLALPPNDARFVPTSTYFRMEFRKYLEEKYKNIETLMRNWSMTSSSLSQLDEKKRPLATFDQLANLIPLWSPTRGIGAMLDPTTNQLYTCDNKRSSAWDDIKAVTAEAERRRYQNLVPSIRSVTDVPVIQDWLGWASPYEGRNPPLDGIGMRASGTSQSVIAESGSRATSSVLRWVTHGWLAATDIDLGAGSAAVTQLPSVLDNVMSMGAKGIFVRADTPALLKKVAEEAAKRIPDSSQANFSPLPVYFPENAYNPAVPQKLPGNHWWLPCPADGNRIDLGSMFFAYRSSWDSGTIALWTRKPGRYRLRLSNSKTAHFETLDASDPLPKYMKGGVELQLTEVPLIITGTTEVPVPEMAYLETVQRFQTMLQVAAKTLRDTSEDLMYFQQTVAGFDRNPGGSLDLLRKQYWKLGAKVAAYCWISGERANDTNFSEVEILPGCAGGGALALRTLIPPGPGGYYAEYNVPVKSREDQTIWLAAKIPPERRGDVTVSVGGQSMRLSGDPLSIYGPGFGWYKLGTTRLAGNMSKLRIEVDSPGNAEIAIDTILVTPGEFIPNGVTPPDPIAFRQLQQKPKSQKRKGLGGLFGGL